MTETQTQEYVEPVEGHVLHIEPHEEDDEGFVDEGTDTNDSGSILTSLKSSIMRGVLENGRTYASYGKEEYGMPIDEQEMDRIDMSHAKYYMLLDKRRYLAPISPHVQKVLDLGTGTGIWSIDFADEHPAAQVIVTAVAECIRLTETKVVGVDIAPIQPKYLFRVSPNCTFEIDDIEQAWTWKEESFDYIFARDLLVCIRDWPRLLEQCYRHLKPGGWLELQCIYGAVGCDDGSLPEDSNFIEYDKLVRGASRHNGTPLEDAASFKGWMEEAGFESIRQHIFKIPSNPWPKEPRLRLIGAYELEMFIMGLEGMSLRLFQKGLGWSPEQTSVFLVGVRNDIKNRKYHAYYPFYVVYGRKPGNLESEKRDL